MKMIVLPALTRSRRTHEELLGLLRREHAGRLVEDQDVRAAVEHLDDLGPLLQADRQVARARVGIEREAVARASARRSPCAPCAWS